ncbi:MAG TPA: cytochrome c oxidase assembly protein [Acidimicrobiales bacterium]|nr:cytochrome c oxidase assembly protein [Acidimicrobiales bacterium]
MLGVTSPPGIAHHLIAGWRADGEAWCVLAVLACLGIGYAFWAARIRRLERIWSPWRTASFLTGLGVVEVAIASPLASSARSLFSTRVVQLALLADVAPTLLALGSPIRLTLQAAPRRVRRFVARGASGHVARAITHPVLTLGVLAVSAYAYFLTPLYRLSMHHAPLLVAVEAEFLAAGCLFWWTAIGVDELPHHLSEPVKLLYLGVTIPPGAFLGIDILNTLRPLASGDTLADTHLGGAVLWGFADLYTLAALGLVYVRWMRDEDRRELMGGSPDVDLVDEAERIVAAAAAGLEQGGKRPETGATSP